MAVHNGSLTLPGAGAYIDLATGELRNAQIQNLAADPGTAVLGQVYYHTGTGKLRVCTNATGPVFADVGGSGSGDVTGGSASSVGEVAVYTNTGGKAITRSNGITGIAKLASGVLSAAASGTDYLLPNGSGAALTGITQSQVASLVSDLGAKAPLASPALTGTPTAPTASAATNSTQVATTAYVDAATVAIVASTNALVFKGVIDCSADPNYPAADAGWVYKVSVAGKIGGASGPNVEAGDVLTCTTDGTAAGNHATVGANWIITQSNLDAATTAVAGSVSLATAGEAEAHTVSTKAVTPAALANFARTYTGTCGNGTLGTASGTPIVVTHSLALTDRDAFNLTLVKVSTHAVETCEVASVDTNSLNLWGWTTAPTTNSYRVTVTGK